MAVEFSDVGFQLGAKFGEVADDFKILLATGRVLNAPEPVNVNCLGNRIYPVNHDYLKRTATEVLYNRALQ